jgi:hypothetical protein
MNDFLIQKEKAKEKMFEAMLEYAGACHAENIANEMKAEDELEEQIPFPPDLDARMRKLISRQDRKESFIKVRTTAARILPKVAIFFFAAFVSFTILVTSVEAFRTKVLNFIIEVGKEYTSIDLKESDSDASSKGVSGIPPDWKGVYVPAFVPEGFKITKAESLMFTKIIHYSNDNGQLIVYQQHNGENTNIRVDTENAVSEEILINGLEGLLFEKKGTTTLVWHNNDFSFSLMSEIDKDELIKMAESIKKE